MLTMDGGIHDIRIIFIGFTKQLITLGATRRCFTGGYPPMGIDDALPNHFISFQGFELFHFLGSCYKYMDENQSLRSLGRNSSKVR